MDKKRCISLIILLFTIVLIVLGVKGNIIEENRQNMNLRSGDDNSHWFHLSGIVVEKTFDTLLVELNDNGESNLFFDMTEVSLDCTKCKEDLEQVSEGDGIKFYFFKYNIDGGTVKIERIVK